MKKLRRPGILFLALLLCRLAGANDVYTLFPDVKGWDKSFNYAVYTPDDLWDYIDGAAEGYLAQGFVDLHIAEYSKGKQVIRVEIYRQKNADQGFGIYSQERSPDLNFIDIGEKGYLQSAILNFVNGEYYVKLSASSDKKAEINTMKEIAGKLSDNINPDPQLPEVLGMFPEKGRLPNQDAFISSSFMGHEFLNAVYKADYKTGDATFSLFIMKEINAAACEQILRQYLEFAGQPTGNLTQGRITVKDPYNGDIEILWKGNWIYGVSGTSNRAVADGYLGMISPEKP